MIRLIEALNYRCLRYVSTPLGPFHVLVGPNASGKTTFLDVVGFLGQLVSDGLEAAVSERTANFQDLVWSREEQGVIELAIEAEIPEELRAKLPKGRWDTVRYEVRLGHDGNTQEVAIMDESVMLTKWKRRSRAKPTLFPMEPEAPASLMTPKVQGNRRIVSKTRGGDDHFYSEVLGESGKGWFPTIRLGPRKSALGNLPEDETKFPVSTWLKKLLSEGVQSFVLNSLLIRKASAPGQRRGFKPDGSNLPWVIADLEQRTDRFERWIGHLRTALPDIRAIRTIERPDDRHRYLVVDYEGGLSVPSWMVSDGTLRLLALTIPAYIPEFKGVYLIEEPENGVHPGAVETLFQSLSSVYDAQILLASHSPVILNLAEAETVLCFKKTERGATNVVCGSEHPALRQWRGETNLGTLLASGVLG